MKKVFDRIWQDKVVWGKLNGDHAFVGLSDSYGIYCQYNLAITPILRGCSVDTLEDKGFIPNADQTAPVPNWERCAADPKGGWQLTKRHNNHFSQWEEVKRYPTFCGALLKGQEGFLDWDCVEIEINFVSEKLAGLAK